MAVVLVLAPLVLVAVSWWEFRAILRSPHPGRRGIVALAGHRTAVSPAVRRDLLPDGTCRPASFSTDPLSRVDTLYFTVTVFSTVGFGDISPASESARILAMIQMILNLVVLGAGIRLLSAAVRRGREAKDVDADEENEA